MAPVRKCDDQNIGVSSPPLVTEVAEEMISTDIQQLSTFVEARSLFSPRLPILSFDLITEILCRLPVKTLLQLRCISKSWKSLISDPIFAKKHLSVSITRHHTHHIILICLNDSYEFLMYDSSITSLFSNSKVPQTLLNYPTTGRNGFYPFRGACSCDGILCLSLDHSSNILWNPSIRKWKILPFLENPEKVMKLHFFLYSFGYDHHIDNYKVIAVFFYHGLGNDVYVHTLGTNYWKRIDDFPYSGPIRGSGIFVNGNVNWLTSDLSNSFSRTIVSLDLEKETYGMIPQPDLGDYQWTLGVLKDCLSIFEETNTCMDVWIMKEYGKKKSWTKLYSIPFMGDREFDLYTRVLYMYDNDQLLMDLCEPNSIKMNLVVYDSKNDVLKIPEIQNISRLMDPEIYVESFIAP